MNNLIQINKARNKDISRLIDETIIHNLLEDKFGDWYPEELIDKITEYIEEDHEIQNQIEESIDSCLDYLSFGENEGYTVDNIDYEIEEDEVVIRISMNFYLSLDASAHCDSEGTDLGSPSCHLVGIISGSIPIEWKSKQTNAISVDSQLDNIQILFIVLLSVDALYPNNEEPDDYEEPADYEE